MIIKIIESTRMQSTFTRLLESVNISILEMLELAEPLKKALAKHELEIPSELKNYKKIDVQVDGKDIYAKIDNKTIMRLGKLLSKMYPTKKTDYIRDIISDVRNYMSNPSGIDNSIYKFELKKNNISQHYKDCEAPSCMTKYGRGHLVDTYDIINSGDTHFVDILLLKHIPTDKYIGRALIWHHVDGANNGIFMDRVYPAKSPEAITMFQNYAIENDWSYRDNDANNYDVIYNGDDELSIDISDVWDEIQIMPYIDTFRFAEEDGGILYNTETSDTVHTFTEEEGYSIGSNPKIEALEDFLYSDDTNKNLSDFYDDDTISLEEDGYQGDYATIDGNHIVCNLRSFTRSNEDYDYYYDLRKSMERMIFKSQYVRELRFNEIIKFVFHELYNDETSGFYHECAEIVRKHYHSYDSDIRINKIEKLYPNLYEQLETIYDNISEEYLEKNLKYFLNNIISEDSESYVDEDYIYVYYKEVQSTIQDAIDRADNQTPIEIQINDIIHDSDIMLPSTEVDDDINVYFKYSILFSESEIIKFIESAIQ